MECNHESIIASYNKPELSDCIITDIHNTKTIYVNSFILRISSKYFNAYFNTQLSSNKSRIIVDNIKIAEIVIKYFYLYQHPFINLYNIEILDDIEHYKIIITEFFQIVELANMWLVSNNIKKNFAEYLSINIYEILKIDINNLIWIELNFPLSDIPIYKIAYIIKEKIHNISDELLINEYLLNFIDKDCVIEEGIRRGFHNMLLQTDDIEYFNDSLNKFVNDGIIYKHRDISKIRQYIMAHPGIDFENIDEYTNNDDFSDSYFHHHTQCDIAYISSVVPLRIIKYYHFIGRWYNNNHKHNAILIMMDNYLHIKDTLIINNEEFKIKSIYWKNMKVIEAFPNEIYSVSLIKPLPDRFDNIYKLI
jgi:hypothetical protein